MKHATIYCGLAAALERDGMDKTDWKIRQWQVKFAEHFGGYTKQVCSGGWLNPDRLLVEDAVLRIEVLLTHAHHEEQLHDLILTMPAMFYQECIMLRVAECDAEFIYVDK